jgi:glutamate/tyrosine decarboxylase-like PLP-dependent enzyme
MDPPAPLIAWAGELWNARLNQNLLHAETSPAANLVERYLVNWLAPFFGMDGGHFTSGSTLANLTALWAARDLAGVDTIVASVDAHVSVRKAAHILGLRFCPVSVDEHGQLDRALLPIDLSRAALVLTAGTTSTGAIDALDLDTQAAWTHVDAAWGGPLRLSPLHANLLNGIEHADSVCLSAHKLFFQPKGSAIILFRNTDAAHAALEAQATYLDSPNIGILGSRPATAVPLYLTLLAWGQQGLVQQLDRCMEIARLFGDWIESRRDLELFRRPVTGVLLWRPRDQDIEGFRKRLPAGLASKTMVHGETWLRNVAANPLAQPDLIAAAVTDILESI